MRIIFFGTSDFAVPGLEKLAGAHDIAAVVTKPDKPQGRRLTVAASPVKIAAERLGLNVISIQDWPVDKAEEALEKLLADLFVVISYGQILPSRILSVPKIYSIGLHASLLPKYRGPSPVNWAILNGEKETGTTVFKLNEKMDAGEMIAQRREAIQDSDNAETLGKKLAVSGSELLLEAVGSIENGRAELKKQDDAAATFTPKLKKEDGAIDWEEDAGKVRNKIRAFYGWPGAFSRFNGRLIKIWKAEVAVTDQAISGGEGRILKIDNEDIVVRCGSGALKIKEVQPAGGRRMSAAEYARGHGISVGGLFVK